MKNAASEVCQLALISANFVSPETGAVIEAGTSGIAGMPNLLAD